MSCSLWPGRFPSGADEFFPAKEVADLYDVSDTPECREECTVLLRPEADDDFWSTTAQDLFAVEGGRSRWSWSGGVLSIAGRAIPEGVELLMTLRRLEICPSGNWTQAYLVSEARCGSAGCVTAVLWREGFRMHKLTDAREISVEDATSHSARQGERCSRPRPTVEPARAAGRAVPAWSELWSDYARELELPAGAVGPADLMLARVRWSGGRDVRSLESGVSDVVLFESGEVAVRPELRSLTVREIPGDGASLPWS